MNDRPPAEPEVWLRGPVAGVVPLLQPVAHSLLQCREEARRILSGLTVEQVWSRPANAAAVGYHIRHAIGSLDRLLTYARGESLSDAQRAELAGESRMDEHPMSSEELVVAFDAAVDRALAQVRATAELRLVERREVGRGKLPSTVVGLLFHAAEHTQRHVGQATTTAKIVSGAR